MNVEQRIACLERELRLWRVGVGSVILMTVCFVSMGAQRSRSAPARVAANEFVLLDENGKERGALRMVERQFGAVVHRGPFLALTDSKGTSRVELGCIEGNNGTNEVDLDVKNKDGQTQIGWFAMSETDAEQATLYLRHKSGPGVDITAATNLADVEVTGKRLLAAAAAQMFATTDSRGFTSYDIKEVQEGVVETIPEILLDHENQTNKITLYDVNGKPVWTKP